MGAENHYRTICYDLRLMFSLQAELNPIFAAQNDTF